MAKLNGVKTVDMINGEITKVSYEGVEYAKVEGKAEKGDLLLSNENLTDISVGDFFSVLSEGEFIDNGGDTRGSDAGFDYTFFRKISADKPTLAQRVETLESDVAALKGEKVASETKLKAGDYVKFKEDGTYITAGKTYEVFHNYNGLYFVDNAGNKRWHHFEYEHEILSAEEAKWAKIGRKPNEFKKGDVVRVLGVCSGHEIAGQLGEIVIADVTDQPPVRAVYNDELIELWTRVELVAPVESLFNA